MNEGRDIILVADYHAENIEFRWFNQAGGEERTGKYPTTRAGILRQIEQAARELEPGGRVVWIMESTTGWARVKGLLGERARFVLANVLAMPLARRPRHVTTRSENPLDAPLSVRLPSQLPEHLFNAPGVRYVKESQVQNLLPAFRS